MYDVLGCKQAIYGSFQGRIPLGLPKTAVHIRLIQLQVTFIDVDASFGTVIPHLECVKDKTRIPIGRNVDGIQAVIHETGKET